jgi:O-antigen ligase
MIVISILGTGLLFSGNRMPLILFIFGLFLIFLSNLKIKKILLLSLVVLSVLFKFIISSDESYKIYITSYYSSYIEEVENTFLTPFDINLFGGKGIRTWARTEKTDEEELVLGQKNTFYKDVKLRSSYLRFALATLHTWKSNKIFGNGIKSFYTDCHKLSSDPNIRIEEDQFPDKINLLCSNHPHNYYFQILTTTGIVGLFITFLIGWSFLVLIFKNFKFIKKFNMTNVILLSVIISFFLEMFPLRNTGSLYTTNNATYIILIGSIILSYKELLKLK